MLIIPPGLGAHLGTRVCERAMCKRARARARGEKELRVGVGVG